MRKQIIIILSMLFILSSCSNKESSTNYEIAPTAIADQDSKAAYQAETPMSPPQEVRIAEEKGLQDGGESETQREEKKIVNGDLNIKLKNFDENFAKIKDITIENGGYLQNSSVYTVSSYGNVRSAYVVLRIPAEKYEFVKNEISALGKLVSMNENTDDVSTEYYDTQIRLERKKTEEERLLTLITEAKDVKDLIELERRLSEVRTDIEIYQERMTNIDKQVSYSTLTVNIQEVIDENIEPVSDDFGEKIKNNFMKSINLVVLFVQNIVIFVAGAIVPLAIISILAVVGFVVFKRTNKK